MTPAHEHVTILPSELILEQIWDVIDGERLRNGERAAAALARHMLKAAREYQSSEVQDGGSGIYQQ